MCIRDSTHTHAPGIPAEACALLHSLSPQFGVWASRGADLQLARVVSPPLSPPSWAATTSGLYSVVFMDSWVQVASRKKGANSNWEKRQPTPPLQAYYMPQHAPQRSSW
eukprot:4686590-Alexandrium_andersonii.AAC.1